jgi:hypothetical protein
MSHDADHDSSALDAKAKRLQDTVRRLVLMKETGPKSAAWHRARVQMIWRLHRTLDAQHARAPHAHEHEDNGPTSSTKAEQRQHPESSDDHA